MSKPLKISFVIPAYNEEHYISKCIEAILEATKDQNAEIIVVNNASQDRTKEVALSYPKVRVIDEPVRGTNQARHTGFLHSTGDLVANIDADNLIHKAWISKVHSEFSNDEELVALSGPYIFYDLSDNWHRMTKAFFVLGYPVYVLNNKIFRRGGAVMGGNVVIRKSALEKVGGYNIDLKFYGDDTDTAMRLNKIGLVKFDYRFSVYSSGRRLAEQGPVSSLFLYAMNHLWTALFKKPFTRVYKEARSISKY